MLKPWVDAMSVNPSGGHALFPPGNPPVSQNIPPSNTFLTETHNKQSKSSEKRTSSEAPTGATSQSPSSSQGVESSEDFSVESEQETRDIEPIIYREVR
jgi:hypothetical protein